MAERPANDARNLVITASLACIVVGFFMCRGVRKDADDREAAAAYEPQRAKEEQSLLRCVNKKTGAREWALDDFVLQEYERQKVLMIANYTKAPSGRTVIGETKAIAQYVLACLVKAGKRPTTEQIFVSVWARHKMVGETGTPVTAVFGRTNYDFSTDSLEWVPAGQF